MEIIWHGDNFFEIIGKSEIGKISIAIDPFKNQKGKDSIAFPQNLKADILLFSKNQNLENKNSSNFLINSAGEYEIKGVFIKGIPVLFDALNNNKKQWGTIFLIEFEGMKICYLANLSEFKLPPEVLEELVSIDIIFIPIGEDSSILPKEAIKLINQIEPKIVIPIAEDEKPFLKALGIKEKEKIKQFKIKKEQLKTEGTEIVLLEPYE